MSEAVLRRIADAKTSGDWNAFVEAIPYARFLGLVASPSGSGMVAKLPYAPHLVGNASLPALHGGTMGALLESVCIFQLLWEAEAVFIPKTITITVDYLRPARPVETTARAIVTRQGKRVASVRAEAWQEDPARPVALATAHFLTATSGRD